MCRVVIAVATWLVGCAGASAETAAIEDAPSLPMTRAEFVLALRAEAPGIDLPTMRCGSPLSLRHCWGDTGTGLRIEAADTYTSVDAIAAFQAGAEGKLYHWSVKAADRSPEQTVELFLGCTVAIKVARGVDLVAAGEMLNKTMDAAVADDDRTAVDRSHPAILVVDLRTEPLCMVTAQWYE